jgi:predicted acetyltransferase
MNIYIKKASISDKRTIHKLIQPYLDEVSQFPDDDPDETDEQGIYHYPYLDKYWQEATRFPYLLFRETALAGFALVSYYDGCWNMSEIYVLPEFRKLGVAFDCVAEIFQYHPGDWRIGFNKSNDPSRSLWDKLTDILSAVNITRGSSDVNHDYIRFSI